MLKKTLRDWLAEQPRPHNTQADFAGRLSKEADQDVPVATVNRWVREPRDPLYTVPQPAMVQLIRGLTGGEVDGDSWYPQDVALPLRSRAGRREKHAAQDAQP